MQLNIHDSTLKRVGFINNNLPDALHYFDDNWHRYLAEGTSTFDFSVNKVNSSYALLTLQSYISFTYDGEDYLFNIINIEQDHYSMHLQCENLNLELISEEVGAYGNTKRHSIVWYLKNVAKITNDFVEIGNNPFPLNDEDSSNPILSFDSTDTKLARIISICNSFNAEFQFRTQLKNDGTLQNITIDLYKEEGVGQKRKDVTLYYGKNIAGITSKADRTSTFFNATTVTDSKNKFNWLSVEGKHYNSDGQLEFYKNAGDNTAYAPLSRDMFPSQLKSSSSDRYTRKNLSIEATSANSLWDYAVSQFKLYAYPQMTYEVSVAVNAVTSALGNDRKLDIGDTIIVQDSTFDKSDGGLILSARVSEQEISFTNPHNNKITFTNFVRLKSEISADLYGRMKDLVDQNTPYKAEVETTNGLQFKNGKGSTTLTARIYFGSDSTETKADSYEWTKDGTLVANVQEITVDASEIDGKAVYAYKATVNEKVVGTASVTITNVNDGERGPQGLKGDPGATGIPGQAGADGKTSYLHIAYATNSTGTSGFDVSNATGKTYIGQYTDFTIADSTDPSKYTWSLIKGDKGDKGDTGPQGPQGERGIAGATGATGSPGPKGADGRSSYIHIKYAPVINPTDSQITDTPNAYIGVYTDYNQADSTSASAYTWSKWQGEDGANGVAGAKGADGRTTYVHFAYANSTNGQTNFSTSYFDGALYMGTLTDYTQTDSTNYAAYTWSRLKGDKGDKGDQGIQGIQGVDGRQGIPGPKGADGKTQYTHIAYANSADGVTNFSTSDSNRAYIGMYVDFNIDDSTTPSDYSWTLVKGADGTQGTPGKAGADGKTPYFHTAWSYSADGTDKFTTTYPNLNLLVNSSAKTKDGFFKDFGKVENGYGEVTLEGTNGWDGRSLFDGFSIYPRDYKPGDKYTMSMDIMFTSWNFPAGTYLDEFWMGQRYTYGGGIWSWKSICTINLPRDPSKMLNQWIRITQTSTIPPYEDPAVNTETILSTIFRGPSKASFTMRVRKPKQEPGSIATLHMPSASEVTTADWPSYIGQYTDFTQADSTNPSDYTWSLIRGNDGKDGANGKDGIAGKDGVGIKTTVITYALSSSGTDKPVTGWTSQVPSLVKGQYLWTKTVWTYTDSSSETGYSVTYIAKDGNNGNDGIAGKDGVGIKTTTITYAGSTSGTTVPNTGWTSTVPTVAAGSYLWTKTVWAYTDNTIETGYSVGKMGNTGPAGPAGSNGNPGKVVSDTEPTTKFVGLTWKYSGITAVDAYDGTNIQPNTEYYWNGKNWVIYLINAQNIDVEKLTALTANLGDATAGSLTVEKGATGGIAVKDGLVKSWDISKMTDPNYPDGYSYTSMGVALDSGGLTFYSAGYGHTLDKGGVIDSQYKVASLQAIASNGRNSIGTGLVLNATNSNFPFTINGNIDVIGGIRQTSKTASVTIGAGLILSLERRGDMVEATLSGSINSPLSSNTNFTVGTIPVGYRPNSTAYIMVHMTSSVNSSHIDVGTNGVCTWWGTSTNTGAPRGHQMWFTNDSLPN